MPVRPISPDALVDTLAGRIAAEPGRPWLRVAVDGAPAADPDALARALVDPLRVRGRAALPVRADDFLRPASLRFEHGRTDPDARYDDWLDTGAVAREVLDPLESDGSGRVLPSLWDTTTDRATRAGYVRLPAGGVLLLSGALLLGRWLSFDLTVHLTLSPGALRRRTPAQRRWELPAFARYTDEVDPVRSADVVVKMDDPRHPALLE